VTNGRAAGQAPASSPPTSAVLPVFPSTTALLASPQTAVTNEVVTLVATVASVPVAVAPSGTVAFEDGGSAIPGCSNVAVSSASQGATAVCQTSFPATTAELGAIFTPSPDGSVMGSSSPTESFSVAPDASVTSLGVSSAANIGSSTTYTASVTPPPARLGPVEPTGAAEFLDGGQPIEACLSQRLTDGRATCTVTYATRGTHTISARYLGDANFAGSSSTVDEVSVGPAPPPVLGFITSTMQWTFYYTSRYTEVRALVVNGAALGTSIRIECSGKGCPFTNHRDTITDSKQCGQSATRACRRQARMDLAPLFGNRRLVVGTRVTVTLARPHWIAKVYAFTVQAGRGPRVQITCLAPGSTRPGVRC
jgi:Bacterial Ig-like domain (group 3)